jgi:hypothetical protein
MRLISPPAIVDCLVAAVLTSSSGELGAVIVTRDVSRSYMLILDALAGSFSDFDGFCEALFDRCDELAGEVRSRTNPVVFTDPDIYERVGRHVRIDLSASGHAHLFKPPRNCGHVNCAYYPFDAERDPERRFLALAASSDALAMTPPMARKAMHHPFDALVSARYDPAAPNVLADALGRAFDIMMITNTGRHKAAHRRGEI